MSKNRGRSQRGFLPWWITVPVFLIVCGSLFINLVQYQVSIASKQQELQIGELSTQSGQVQISGRIEYLQYAENQQSGGGLLARLFR